MLFIRYHRIEPAAVKTKFESKAKEDNEIYRSALKGVINYVKLISDCSRGYTHQEKHEMTRRLVKDTLKYVDFLVPYKKEDAYRHALEDILEYFEILSGHEEYTIQEKNEIFLRTLEDVVEGENLSAEEKKIIKITDGITKHSPLWRLVNNTPKEAVVVKYPLDISNSIKYLDTLVQHYTDYLANIFRRMIVNKRAVEENMANGNIYVQDRSGIRCIMFDILCTDVTKCVETETGFLMNGRTQYKKLVNYTQKSGYHNGCSFQEILSDKFQKVYTEVAKFVQNRHMFETETLSTLYCEVCVSGNDLVIQAVYDESE